VKQIKQILEAAGVNYSDCTEKNELEELLAKLRANPMGCARASGGGRDSSEQEKVIVCDMSMSMWKEHMIMVGGGTCCCCILCLVAPPSLKRLRLASALNTLNVFPNRNRQALPRGKT
jgi:hypothetical protein